MTIEDQTEVQSRVLPGRLFVGAFLSAVGLCVALVVGSIAWGAVKNHGLIPKPDTPDRYDCGGTSIPISIYYLHGSDRVQVQSPQGTLNGTLHQNIFDWGNSADQLGFPAPTAIRFEDAKSFGISGPGYAAVLCTMNAAHSGHRREIAR
jgi:hypothetical protein